MSEVDLINLLQAKSIGSIFNTTLPAAESNFFTSNIPILNNGIVRITLQASVAGLLRVKLIRNSTSVTLNLNSLDTLIASALYSFDVPIKYADYINIVYSNTGGTIDYCEVQLLEAIIE